MPPARLAGTRPRPRPPVSVALAHPRPERGRGRPWATHRDGGAAVALLEELLQGDHLAARGGAGPHPCVGMGRAPPLDTLLGGRPVPGRRVLLAAEGGAPWGAGVPGRRSRVPAGDQVLAAEALGPAVEAVGGAWGQGKDTRRNTSGYRRRTADSPAQGPRVPGSPAAAQGVKDILEFSGISHWHVKTK